MMTVTENARTTPENRFQIMLLNNTRPAGQPASDRGEYETQGQSAPEQNMSGIPVPVVLPHVPRWRLYFCSVSVVF